MNIKNLTDTMALATREMLECHSMMDETRVPTHINGGRMSLSQRVAVLVGTWKTVTEHFPGSTQAIQAKLDSK